MRILNNVLAVAGARWRQFTDLTDRERGDVPGWVMVTVMTAIELPR